MSETITNKKEVEIEYSKLLRNPSFDQLSIETEKPNIFRALGVSNHEIRHSNFLSWLLDPHENHGLGDIILKKFLQDILIHDKAKDISIISVAKLDISKVEVRREWKNIDILVITEDFIVCVENKMWSLESKHQLAKYAKTVKAEFPEPKYKHCFVFLTPHGEESSIPNLYIDYSYKKIVEILEGVLITRATSINPSIRIYLNDYITLLRQNIMSDDTTNELAKQLYLNHKDLFDFVFENRPDISDNFVTILNEKVIEQGWKIGSRNKWYVRFLTPQIEELILIYNRANGWPNKEAFLFEFDFRNNKRIIFRTVVSDPKDNFNSYDKRIVEILSELDGAKGNLGAKWKCHFSRDLNWNLEEVMDDWNDTSNNELNRFINDIKPIVAKVETQLLKHKDELLALKAEYYNE